MDGSHDSIVKHLFMMYRWTDAYPESAWLSMWTVLAARYVHNPMVIGADLRNELRPDTRPGMSWRNPTWTDIRTGNPKTNWRAAATACGNQVRADYCKVGRRGTL